MKCPLANQPLTRREWTLIEHQSLLCQLPGIYGSPVTCKCPADKDTELPDIHPSQITTLPLQRIPPEEEEGISSSNLEVTNKVGGDWQSLSTRPRPSGMGTEENESNLCYLAKTQSSSTETDVGSWLSSEVCNWPQSSAVPVGSPGDDEMNNQCLELPKKGWQCWQSFSLEDKTSSFNNPQWYIANENDVWEWDPTSPKWKGT